MDDHSRHSKRVLPNTPRVSDKIADYYKKFGYDRELEKFMRLYSPASSQDSQKTQGEDCMSTLDSCCKRKKGRESASNFKALEAMMPSNSLSACNVTNSKSLPNIDVQGHSSNEKEPFSASDIIVDINIESEGEKEKILSISTENMETPQKHLKNTKTQTPESVAKTHRRLEWDSLGDVGYKKSMSTSNISIVERSLLKEYFKENSIVSEPVSSVSTREQNLTEEHKTVNKLKTNDIEQSSPPLACSTLVEIAQKGAKPKMITQSTSSTSLNKKFEKYAQTSLIQPPTVHSQEIQCSMSSSNSILEGTATPSSFEYYSSKSSKSSSDFVINTRSKKQCTKPLDHPFIASITDILMKRKALGEKNTQVRHQFNNIRELQEKFQAALDENKENQSHFTVDSSSVTSFSLSKQAPELDLGIQLICSLIDAKSVNVRQKKQLIRDIVKRISRMELKEHAANAATTTTTSINSSSDKTTNSSDCCQRRHIYDSVRSCLCKCKNEEIVGTDNDPLELGVSPLNTHPVNAQENSLTSTTNTSINVNAVLAPKQCKDNVKSKSLHFPESTSHIHKNQLNDGCKHFPYKTKNSHNESHTNVSSATLINKATQSDLVIRGRRKESSKQTSQVLQTNQFTTSRENKTSCTTQTSKTTTPTTSTSTTTTPELTTQKFIAPTNYELNNSNTDAEQTTMREWLNPLTQSEIEYEEKKQKEAKKKSKAQQEKLRKKSKYDSGRIQQLNWIENEITRLECLKHLLLKDETYDKSSTSVSSLEHTAHEEVNITKDSTQTNKLYDTVFSDKSSVLSESAERLVQEIEIILEESHEDVVNFKDNIKRNKERKKETKILYETGTKTKPNKTIVRTINENINFHEEQLLNGKESEKINRQRHQREKIDTPSTIKSVESESLRDLVQQRKREFMEAYKTKKENHYEALKQQQKKDLKYLNTQRKINEKIATSTDSQHYSVPHTLPRKNVSNEVSYAYTKHPLPLTPTEREIQLKPHQDQREHIIYCTTATKQKETVKPFHQEIVNTTAVNTSNTLTTTSSSSMFCMSSEVSVPMGSQSISSTPTTTHQYDDVAVTTGITGVAVQTSDSIMRSKPIYGPKHSLTTLKTYADTASSTTACIQVKPKGIAYVIEFDDNKHATSNSTSNTDINSNNVHLKSCPKSDNFLHTNKTNNMHPLLPTEPQLTLQEHLEKSNPKFLQHSKERKAILNQLQSMRQERDRQLREIIENTSFNSLDRRLKYLPPPPIQKVRILNTKEMKALTNKRFASLPEVLAKHEREIEEKKRRSNRILRDVFNKRLQKRVRSGKLSLNHSKTVI